MALEERVKDGGVCVGRGGRWSGEGCFCARGRAAPPLGRRSARRRRAAAGLCGRRVPHHRPPPPTADTTMQWGCRVRVAQAPQGGRRGGVLGACRASSTATATIRPAVCPAGGWWPRSAAAGGWSRPQNRHRLLARLPAARPSHGASKAGVPSAPVAQTGPSPRPALPVSGIIGPHASCMMSGRVSPHALAGAFNAISSVRASACTPQRTLPSTLDV